MLPPAACGLTYNAPCETVGGGTAWRRPAGWFLPVLYRHVSVPLSEKWVRDPLVFLCCDTYVRDSV